MRSLRKPGTWITCQTSRMGGLFCERPNALPGIQESCHCSNIRFTRDWPATEPTTPIRACGCDRLKRVVLRHIQTGADTIGWRGVLPLDGRGGVASNLGGASNVMGTLDGRG